MRRWVKPSCGDRDLALDQACSHTQKIRQIPNLFRTCLPIHSSCRCSYPRGCDLNVTQSRGSVCVCVARTKRLDEVDVDVISSEYRQMDLLLGDLFGFHGLYQSVHSVATSTRRDLLHVITSLLLLVPGSSRQPRLLMRYPDFDNQELGLAFTLNPKSWEGRTL